MTEVTRSSARRGERAPVGGCTVHAEAVVRDAAGTTVLVVTNTLKGGTGAHIGRLLERLAGSRWQPLLLCQGSRDFDPPASVPLIDDFERRRRGRFPVAQWRQLRTVHRLVRKHSPALVHAFFFGLGPAQGGFADVVVRSLVTSCGRSDRTERTIVERDFALERVAERYAALYRGVLSNGGGHAT